MKILYFILLITNSCGITIKQGLDRLINSSREYRRHGLWREGFSLHQNKPFYPTSIIFSSPQLISNYYITCFRIPSILNTVNNHLIAFSEARVNSCQDCSVTGIVAKHSFDGGLTWGEISWVVKPDNINNVNNSDRGANPTSLYDIYNNKIVLHFSRGGRINGNGNGNGNNKKWDCIPAKSNWQIVSTDMGETWSNAINIGQYLNKWTGLLPGPGNGIQLVNGRYVFPGHYGTAEREYGGVISYYSDDFGFNL